MLSDKIEITIKLFHDKGLIRLLLFLESLIQRSFKNVTFLSDTF